MAAPTDAEVLVVGSANTDLVARAERLPRPGETLLGGEFFTSAGGKGANQAVAAARAGARVTFAGRVGDDDMGRRALGGLQAEEIDTTYLTTDPDRPSGVALIVVDRAGENSIVVAPGANAALTPAHLEAASPAFTRARVCLLQLEIPLPAVTCGVSLASKAGAYVILNPAPAQDLSPDALGAVDLVTPNAAETEVLTGIRPDAGDAGTRAAEMLMQRGAGSALITLGAEGSLLVTPSGSRRFAAPRVQAVDTTAAGDAFNGALACEISRGVPLHKAVVFASCAGALAATLPGAQPSLPTRSAIGRLMGTGPASAP